MRQYYKKRKTSDESNPFTEVKVFLPKVTHFELKKISLALNKPLSRLIAIAVDNELDSQSPFNYPSAMPTTTYVKLLHLTNAMKLLDFIKSTENGITIESMLLCRRVIGISERSLVMEAYRELLESGLVEEYVSIKTGDSSVLVKAVERGEGKKIRDSKQFVKRIKEDEGR